MNWLALAIRMIPKMIELIKAAEKLFDDQPDSGPEKKQYVMQALQAIIEGASGGAGDPTMWEKIQGALDPVLERLAANVLEDDVRVPVVLARVDHHHDVRVRESRDGARFAAEALERSFVLGDVPMQDLDRDLALERLVERAIDRRHPAGPDPVFDPVAAVQPGADDAHSDG